MQSLALNRSVIPTFVAACPGRGGVASTSYHFPTPTPANRLRSHGTDRCSHASSLSSRASQSQMFGQPIQELRLGETTRCIRDTNITCMAHPRRVEKVAQQIRRELGVMLLNDKVLKEAVLPEAALGADMFLSSVATISDIELSKDLQVVKVYVSVYGDERVQDKALEGLKARAGYVRAGLGRRMSLRMTPEVRFFKDDSLERGGRVLEILEKIREDRERKERGEPIDYDDGDNWEDPEGEAVEVAPKSRAKKAVAQKVLGREPRGSQFVKPRAGEEDEDSEGGEDFGEDENIIFVK
eukprot:jgi/Mesen1/7209/ME000371S06287